jgi:hypothetical protein
VLFVQIMRLNAADLFVMREGAGRREVNVEFVADRTSIGGINRG